MITAKCVKNGNEIGFKYYHLGLLFGNYVSLKVPSDKYYRFWEETRELGTLKQEDQFKQQNIGAATNIFEK